jgi:hypothetical protein
MENVGEMIPKEKLPALAGRKTASHLNIDDPIAVIAATARLK